MGVIPVATRLVVRALRDEAQELLDGAEPTDYGMRRIARSLGSVADRLEAAGSTSPPSAPRAPSPAPAISEPDLVPPRADEERLADAIKAIRQAAVDHGVGDEVAAQIASADVLLRHLSLD